MKDIMKVGELIKILQLLDPESYVTFIIGSDMEQRREIYKAFGDPYIFTTDLYPVAAIVDHIRELSVEIELKPSSILDFDDEE